MADSDAAAKRVAGLTKLFNLVIHGHRNLNSPADGNRFLEALCSQEDVSKSVELLVTTPAGLASVARAFRFSNDSSFLNGPAASYILRLSDPSLKQLYDGQFLSRVLEQIVQPPTFWNTLCEAHNARVLTQEASHAFTWLLHELLLSRSAEVPSVRDIAERVTENESLITSEHHPVRILGQKIKNILSNTSTDSTDGPGGRHDNDFADYRCIAILPTADEFASNERPFYRRADAIDSAEPSTRALLHLDNQFRLLREDFLGELRSDFHIATGQKKGRQKTVLSDLQFAGIDCGTSTRRKFCAIVLQCSEEGIPQLSRIKDVAARKKYILDNKNLLKHQSLGCLVSNGNIIAFASVDRNEELLAQRPSKLVLRVADVNSLSKVLVACGRADDLSFVQVDTAVFAYEPILKCLQSVRDLPLEEQLLATSESSEPFSDVLPKHVIETLSSSSIPDIQSLVNNDQNIRLDHAQSGSLVDGLTKKISLIQGPPGTGKSFIGALIAKILHDHTNETILVLSYTNHALDQFLVDMRNAGVPDDSMVRLGQKSTSSTQTLSISAQPSDYRMNKSTYTILQEQKSELEGYHEALMKALSQFNNPTVRNQALLDYLEFSEDSEYFDAFSVPVDLDDMVRVTKKNKKVDRLYLIDRWMKGKNAGIFHESVAQNFVQIWTISPQVRPQLIKKWQSEIIRDQVSQISTLVKRYDNCRDMIDRLYRQKNSHIIRQKRIIGCTTTAAAKYTEEIRRASPGIILVEEAGEILESHVLTAMTDATKQLILIGDHKQLRPKINNYSLTVEKGDGFNLNVSLFERLLLAGVPHSTLIEQHRMRPEISTLVRSLTYPELEDAAKTQGRPSLRGFQDSVIFVSHSHPEVNADRIADRRDENTKSSKENVYEADMVLSCVRYLGQQGYGTEDIVVLTPYLGQLYLLMKTLLRENDPILNDLDSHELIQAGLLTPAAANVNRRKVRISTIDNYQGEESDIVIACLTRSNEVGDIGFMSAPQRVNVLLSRARNALIMIGNANTFMTSRKGKEVWVPLMNLLKRDGHVYDGFPVKCEQHPDKIALLTEKAHFDSVCPDGGCSEPCGKILNCNVHTCPSRCHQLQDHSKMDCNAVIASVCPNGHKVTRKCHDKAAAICRKCEAAARAAEKRRQRDHQLDQERSIKQEAYARKLAEIEDEIEHERRLSKNRTEEADRQNAILQKKQDLADLKARNAKALSNAAATNPSAPINKTGGDTSESRSSSSSPQQSESSSDGIANTSGTIPSEPEPFPSDRNTSDAKEDWDRQKQYEGAENEAMDSLMAMIGLEAVKQQFLDIKAKVDTVVRQNVSLKGERYGAVLLGNPGTGKTTVARLYGQFLVKMGALPGDHFFETSGSSLANDGVDTCKQHIDKILEQGGGVFFIDEAYQLVSGNSFGGKAVLDYLLAEIENLTGKIVFVLAGYRKQMESFFAHNPGIPSRIPIEMAFEDYEDGELAHIFRHYVNAKYRGAMKLEGGMSGLYVRIVARRIGRGRGRDGFGNARDVQNKISQITERQAKRLRKERRAGMMPDDYVLTKEDLIGPEPSSVLRNNAAWAKLQKLIGLASVKQSVQSLLDGIQANYRREIEEKPLIQYSLNRCFIGSPGTGKTSVAKLYGQILADIGMLSNGEVVVKNPADFVGSVLGGSEANTKAILASTIGKVLIIDEAYMLAGGSTTDPYKSAVIDTIVAEVQSTPGEDRCVLLLGYKEQMEDMFRDVNPGLARRFPLESAFVFEDFDDVEIGRILDLKLKDIGFSVTDQAKRVAMDVLQRARNRPNFGNAGEVDIILDRAKALQQKRVSGNNSKDLDTLEAVDFDPDFDRGERAASNLSVLFKDVVGCEDLVRQIQGYQTVAANMKAVGMDPRDQIPFSFLFKGPPGTGKTTTARKMGKVYYDMGFLSQAKVIECSATDLVGQYVGHTGPKVQKLMETALGKVLFIDEAYRLAEGHFATEAMDELVDCITKPRFAQKLIVILAGYDKDIDRLMGQNPGLTSRFPETIIFKHLDPETCLELLTKTLMDKQKTKNGKEVPLDISVLTPPTQTLEKRILQLFRELSSLDSWGNARDVKSLGKTIFGKLVSTASQPMQKLVLKEANVLESLQSMHDERTRRSKAAGSTRFPNLLSQPELPPLKQQQEQPPKPKAPETSTASAPAPPPVQTDQPAHKLEEQPPNNPAVEPRNSNDPLNAIFQAKRDPGVSDAIWEQLERDKRAFIAREQEYRRAQEEKRQEEQRILDMIRAEQAAADEEERRIREAERIKAVLERRRRDAELAALEEQRAREKKTQQRLRELGPCPAGYHWIKQAGGYRCAGGSHWLSDAHIGV